ncbi:MAG: DUF1492 domain-containing protein [Clostridiales bacterium]|nr:DUF1492 domain-containing protein [Clostridiales bacterium]
MGTAEEYLKSIKRLDSFILVYDRDLKAMEELAMSAAVGELQEDKVQTSINLHKKEDEVVNIIDYQDRISKTLSEYVKRRHDLMKLLDKLEDPKHRVILYEKYMLHSSWGNIADSLNYSISHVKRMRTKAVEELQKIMDQEK